MEIFSISLMLVLAIANFIAAHGEVRNGNIKTAMFHLFGGAFVLGSAVSWVMMTILGE